MPSPMIKIISFKFIYLYKNIACSLFFPSPCVFIFFGKFKNPLERFQNLAKIKIPDISSSPGQFSKEYASGFLYPLNSKNPFNSEYYNGKPEKTFW